MKQLDEYPHTERKTFSQQEVVDYEIGLGAIKKVRGEWRFKHSERLSGTLTRYTWQVVDGYDAAEVMNKLLDSALQAEGASEVFSCDGRACGPGAQWANRVFNERILFGREDLQLYRVYALPGEHDYRLIAYSAQRTADRQYLHVELLRIGQ